MPETIRWEVRDGIAVLTLDQPAKRNPMSERMGEGWPRLQQATRVQRGWGDCYGHCLVASGRLDGMLDPAMNPWDCCALVPILAEAGGRFTDWTGASRVDGGDAFSTNGSLHSTVLEWLFTG